jgi:hypothetical protein
MNENVSREYIEQQLIQKAKEIKIDSQTGCIDEIFLEEFDLVWHKLVKYYEANHDSVIGVQVVHIYLDMINLFFATWQSPNVSEECREAAEESLQILQRQMEYIIISVENRLDAG